MVHTAAASSLLLVAALGTACASSAKPAPPTDEQPPAGEKVDVTIPAAETAELESLRRSVGEVAELTADTFANRYAMRYGPALGYEPLGSLGLERILSSSVAPSTVELDALAKHGFVISPERAFPTFTYGYATLYSQHLPLYVSADSILDAVHRSYDRILQRLETGVLGPELEALLESLRSALAKRGMGDTGVIRDVDFYLSVALGLLTGSASPVAGASPSEVAAFVASAIAAKEPKSVVLFGVSRGVDFSQFVPRGHYTDTEQLKRYFRAMMWLGRIDFRLIETQPSGQQVFYRRQFDAMLALHSLFDATNLARHQAIDETIQSFAGESDNLKVAEVARLLADLGAPADATSVDLPDQRVAQAILDGGYGAQRIASDIMWKESASQGPLPLHRTFLVFGQRYAIDSHVFSNVVYDRVPAKRMMPTPLDVAFAALQNDQGGAMLDAELRAFPYAPNLASMRVLADAHGQEFWSANLYNLWLSSLRALSPTGAISDPASVGMPLVTGTEPWQRRLLNTQLGSWAELRHDTILYVKQSYTTGDVCEFPDAYVDPYPEFFSAFERFADHGMNQVVPVARRSTDVQLAPSIAEYFERLGKTASMLRQMALSERSGLPFSPEMMAFINQAVTVQPTCGGALADGWYPKLVYGEPTKFDPTIADVHTQPADENGNVVGRVLHVGTGNSRLMVVTTNTCTGPRAYAGLVFSYYEKTTENFDRLTDERWAAEVNARTPVDVPWMRDLFGQ
ncbi:MAG TPA: DUF3160 domain-containing protein [Polyangiaceae bacterium]|nr:DUF3160 domain-containing protein [Polyangiaceae bacterium]